MYCKLEFCPKNEPQAVSLGSLMELEQRMSLGSDIASSVDRVGVIPGGQPT